MFHDSHLKYLINKRYYKNKGIKTEVCMWCKCEYTYSDYGYLCTKRCHKKYSVQKSQIFKRNNRCEKHKHSRLTYRNQCWECYKEYFYSGKLPKISRRLSLLFSFFDFCPTFRTSKDSWNGDKIAFEENLKNNKVRWFVYIKFYVNKNGKVVPLVCGKSGSVLVNASGSDLNFSLSREDGPARKFLFESKTEWCYDFIFIRKCKSQSHAYEVERKILERFDLFGS